MAAIDTHLLALFELVAISDSFARAAEGAHMDPTSVSRRMTHLESQLGYKLLQRSVAGIRLTLAGKKLLQRSRELRRLIDSIGSELEDGSGVLEGSVRVAVNPSGVLSVLPPTLGELAKRHPGIRVDITQAASPVIVDMCIKGAVEFGVGTGSDRVTGVTRKRLMRDSLVVLVPRGHPLDLGRSVGLQEVLAWPQVITQLGGGVDTVLFRRAREAGLQLAAAAVVQSYDAALRMVEAGVGIAVISSIALHGFPGDARFATTILKEPWAARALWMYTTWQTPPDPVQAAFRDALIAQASLLEASA